MIIFILLYFSWAIRKCHFTGRMIYDFCFDPCFYFFFFYTSLGPRLRDIIFELGPVVKIFRQHRYFPNDFFHGWYFCTKNLQIYSSTAWLSFVFFISYFCSCFKYFCAILTLNYSEKCFYFWNFERFAYYWLWFNFYLNFSDFFFDFCKRLAHLNCTYHCSNLFDLFIIYFTHFVQLTHFFLFYWDFFYFYNFYFFCPYYLVISLYFCWIDFDYFWLNFYHSFYPLFFCHHSSHFLLYFSKLISCYL